MRRRDLPAEIAANPGFWVIDFPFGIPSEIAQPVGAHGHIDWWRMCAEAVGEGNGATAFRDTIRFATNQANRVWSTRRRVDLEHGTTWFPLFEQLYRQTIFGAGEVLNQLESRENVAILPWDAHRIAGRTSVVAEGFPGVALRNRLGLPASGYKGGTAAHGDRRDEIIDRLRLLMPIPDGVAERASADREGDAIDALLLALAAQSASGIAAEQWTRSLEALAAEGRQGEGWFAA